MNELDEILLEQYHSTLRRKKKIKRMIKIMPHEKQLIEGEKIIDKKIKFIENIISNKDLLKKKTKKKKEETDILARNPVYEWYRNIAYITLFGYKMFSESATKYWYFFKKEKNENTEHDSGI